jgi:hypothetical protein
MSSLDGRSLSKVILSAFIPPKRRSEKQFSVSNSMVGGANSRLVRYGSGLSAQAPDETWKSET